MSRPDPICPRCGYSLVGEVTSWTTVCPLAGRCTECGLEIAWSDVFDPDRQGPRWCIEFARGRSAGTHGFVLLRALLSTWLRALWPWTFFRRIELTHRVQPWRLVLYVCFVLALAYVGFCLGQGYIAWEDPRNGWGKTPLQVAWTSVRSVLLPLSGVSRRYVWLMPERCLWPVWYLIATLILPLTFVLLRTSVRQARVRPGHLARVTVYSFSWFVVIVFLIGLPMYLEAAVGWRWSQTVWSGVVPGVTRWCFPIFLAIPWWIATRRYLRMRHALGVAVAMTVLAVLLSFIFVFTLFRDTMDRVLFW